MDITYVRIHKGWVYLCAVVDWYSRKVLAWRLSNTMYVQFCMDAMQEAIVRWGTPAIFNTDQGSQGGFNRSSQHLQSWRCYGKTSRVDAEVNGTRGNALTRCSFA